MNIETGYVVHYRELDHQGGYWRMTPKGPFKTRKRAREVAENLQNPPSPFNGKRHRSDRIRDVHIKLRIEVGL